MRLVFAGTPPAALPSLDALFASQHEVVAVVTRPDAPSGRGRTLQPSPVAVRATELGVPILRPEHPRDKSFQAQLCELGPDCCPVVGYGALVPRAVLAIPEHGWVNLHFSLLPAWRGAAPVQHAVLAGDRVTGATTFRLVPKMDAGPIFGTTSTPITSETTSGDLLDRLAAVGAALLVDTMDRIEAGSAVAQPQPVDGISLAPKINVEDAQVDWGAPAIQVDRLIRACQPAPGAWTLFRGDRFKINSAFVTDGGADPGQLLVTKSSVRVGTAAGLLELTQVQPSGRRAMGAADWARGAGLAEQEHLG